MESSEFYFGLPGDQWDNLLLEAEDLLRDNKLGTHLVGIYPAGDRIYGIESEPPGLLCLYVDSVESLINPSYYDNAKGFHAFSSGLAGSPIMFFDLFKWARSLISGDCGPHINSMAYAIPFGSDVIHQDSSIDGIIEAAYALMVNNRFNLDRIPLCLTRSVLRKRTDAILASEHIFRPCINPKWGTVYQFKDPGIATFDSRLISSLLNSEKPDKGEQDILVDYYERITKGSNLPLRNTYELMNKLGTEVASLYRFQL
jgi:hypothetical protein